MKEWTDPYNAFNSMKVLVWSKHLEQCAKDDYLPPVTVDTDPSNRCPYNCIWCNAYDILNKQKNDLPEEHLIKLADFYKDWGVKSSCISGGGEPLMNTGLNAFLERMHHNKLESGIITTGFPMTDEHIETMARTCRWVGFSMDAAVSATYNKVKGISGENVFDKVVEKIRKFTKRVADLDAKCDVAFKFLIHPYNAGEIYEAAKLAKSMGVRDFHMRPVGWDNLTKTKDQPKVEFSQVVDDINKQIEDAMQLEDAHFRVYGVRHKFNPNFSRRIAFSRCWAIPILPTFGADGRVHLCFDQRGNEKLILCNHYPDPAEILKVWNTDFHRSMVKGIDPNKCPRCTFGAYNEMVEKVFINDSMCRNFP